MHLLVDLVEVVVKKPHHLLEHLAHQVKEIQVEMVLIMVAVAVAVKAVLVKTEI